MKDYISKSEALKLIPCEEIVARTAVSQLPTIDAVPVVRCKDCKHRPTMPENNRGVFDLEFPDYECPCQCGDPWYNREPEDDWFCANGERSEDD